MPQKRSKSRNQKGRIAAPVKGEEKNKPKSMRLAAVALAVASAIGGAILAGAGKELQTYIAEPMSDIACRISDSLNWNPSPTTFTIVVSGFQNDNGRTIRNKVLDVLRRGYAVNVLESCRQIILREAGDPVAIAKSARNTMRALLEAKQADLAVFGTVREDGSIDISSHYRSTVQYLLDSRGAWSEHIEAAKIEEHFNSIEFRTKLLNAANDEEARFPACPYPLYGICKANNIRDGVTWRASLLRIYDNRQFAEYKLFYDPSAKFQFALLATRAAWTAYFVKLREPEAKAADRDFDYWFLTRHYVNVASNALGYGRENYSYAEGTAVIATVLRSTAEGCLRGQGDTPIAIAKANAEDARKALYGVRSRIKSSLLTDEFRKFIYDLELLRILFLEYSSGILEPAEAKGTIEDILREWESSRPTFVGFDAMSSLDLSLEASKGFLKKYLDAYDLIKAGIAKPPDLTAYSSLGMLDSRYCEIP